MSLGVDHFSSLAIALLPVLADAAAKSVAILAVTAFATFALRRASAAARHLVWLLGLASLLILPILSAALPAWHVLPAWAMASASAAGGAATITGLPPDSPSPQLARNEGTMNSGGPMQTLPSTDIDSDDLSSVPPNRRASPPAARESQISSTPSASARPSWQAWAILGWAVGVSLLLAHILLGLASLAWLGRRSDRITDADSLALLRELSAQLRLRRDVTLLANEHRTMPMVWGIFRIHLLLPSEAADWSAEQRRAVLLHELAHAKRNDCLAQLLAQIIRALYWFNPLAWLACRQMQTEREMACDDLVLRGGTRPSAYAEQLLKIAAEMPVTRSSTAAIAMARPSALEGRLLAILDRRKNRKTVTVATRLVAAIAALLLTSCVAVLFGTNPKPLGATVTFDANRDGRPLRQPSKPIELDAPEAAELASFFPQMGRSNDRFGSWTLGAEIEFRYPNGRSAKVTVSIDDDDWSEGHGDWEPHGDLAEFLNKLRPPPADASASQPATQPALRDPWGTVNDLVRYRLISPVGPITTQQDVTAELGVENLGRKTVTLSALGSFWVNVAGWQWDEAYDPTTWTTADLQTGRDTGKPIGPLLAGGRALLVCHLNNKLFLPGKYELQCGFSESRPFKGPPIFPLPAPLSVENPGQRAAPDVDPTDSAPESWGPAIDHMHARLRVFDSVHDTGNIDDLTLDLRNVGTRQLAYEPSLAAMELQIDGRWYHAIEQAEPPPDLLPFGPGYRWDNWGNGYLHRKIGLYPTADWCDADGRRLKLAHGKHTVRLAIALPAFPGSNESPVRLVTNAVERSTTRDFGSAKPLPFIDANQPATAPADPGPPQTSDHSAIDKLRDAADSAKLQQIQAQANYDAAVQYKGDAEKICQMAGPALVAQLDPRGQTLRSQRGDVELQIDLLKKKGYLDKAPMMVQDEALLDELNDQIKLADQAFAGAYVKSLLVEKQRADDSVRLSEDALRAGPATLPASWPATQPATAPADSRPGESSDSRSLRDRYYAAPFQPEPSGSPAAHSATQPATAVDDVAAQLASARLALRAALAEYHAADQARYDSNKLLDLARHSGMQNPALKDYFKAYDAAHAELSRLASQDDSSDAPEQRKQAEKELDAQRERVDLFDEKLEDLYFELLNNRVAVHRLNVEALTKELNGGGVSAHPATQPASQPTTQSAGATLTVHLLDSQGWPLANRAPLGVPLSVGYSPHISRRQIWSDEGATFSIPGITPGRHWFVFNSGWPEPTIVSVDVPDGGLVTNVRIKNPDGPKPQPDLDITPRVEQKGGRYLLHVSIASNTDRPYTLSAMDLQLNSTDERVFPPATQSHQGAVVPAKGKGKLELTLDWEAYVKQGLWGSRGEEEIDERWPGTSPGKGMDYYRVNVCNTGSLPVALPQPPGAPPSEWLTHSFPATAPPTQPAAARHPAESGIDVAGQVIDDVTGKPVENFVIQSGGPDPKDGGKIEWGGEQWGGAGWSGGRFGISEDRPAGDKLWFRILAPGYRPQPITAGPMTAPATAEGLVIRLRRGIDLHGQVLDSSGHAVAKATVFLAGQQDLWLKNGEAQDSYAGSKTTTDTAGRFVLPVTGDAMDRVVVSCPAMAAWIASVADPTKELTIRLPVPATLRFRYDIPGGADPGEIYVALEAAKDPAWRGVRPEQTIDCRDGGSAALGNLAPGAYYIARWHRLRIGDFGGDYLSDRSHMTLKAGESRSVDFVRTTGQPVTGTMSGLEKTGIPGAIVMIYGGNASGDPRDEIGGKGPLYDALTCPVGQSFKTERLSPGTYTIVGEAYGPDNGELGIRLPMLIAKATVIVPEKVQLQPIQLIFKPLPERPVKAK